MKILSNEKDYYDSLVHVYGIDDNIILNRKIKLNLELNNILKLDKDLFKYIEQKRTKTII